MMDAAVSMSGSNDQLLGCDVPPSTQSDERGTMYVMASSSSLSIIARRTVGGSTRTICPRIGKSASSPASRRAPSPAQLTTNGLSANGSSNERTSRCVISPPSSRAFDMSTKDLAPLANVTKLMVLDLKDNQIADLGPLAKQTELSLLMLE